MSDQNKHNRVHNEKHCNANLCIADLLPVGKENAISTQSLVSLTGCKSSRELQQYIAIERAAGAIICSSSNGGYFLPANHAEIAEFCRTLENRAGNTFAALKSARKALSTPEGQQEFTERGCE